VTQLVPVGAALAGVALTFAGNAWLEHQKWRRSEAGERQARALGLSPTFCSPLPISRARFGRARSDWRAEVTLISTRWPMASMS
jgi:hypothetical protein